MALAVRGVYDDPVHGITRPFVAFQGSNWVGHPGFAITGSDRGQSAPRASRDEWEALRHPLVRRARCLPLHKVPSPSLSASLESVQSF